MFLISMYVIRIFPSAQYLFHYGMKFWAYIFGYISPHAFQCLFHPNLCLHRTHHPIFFFFIVALGCGKGGGDAFFKILTLIGVDTQPSHECIWRNVPIFKINDDVWVLLRKMELPCQPQHYYVDEARGVGAWWCGKHPLQEGRARSQSKMQADFRREWNVWLMKSNQSPLGSEETRPWGWRDPRGGVQVGGMRPTSSPVEQGLG